MTRLAKKTDANPAVILSLGAGVQSSTLALMAARGEVEPMPEAAIFADTHWEPMEVYAWLAGLKKELPFPVHVVSTGDLGADFLAALTKDGSRCGQPPFYVSNGGDAAGGMLWRQCTKDYKLVPIRRKTREIAAGRKVEQWIGISWDEIQRMKESGVGYIENRFPLVERRMTRQDCLSWMEQNGFPPPPRSACVFCPYIHNDRWRWMKQHHPAEFERACRFDESIRGRQETSNGAGITGKCYVHRSFTPLREAVLTDDDIGQAVFDFQSECDGMCGV